MKPKQLHIPYYYTSIMVAVCFVYGKNLGKISFVFTFIYPVVVLNYSQSGISRMIGDLEKEWKVALLERSRTGVKLTSDGTKLLPYACSVCEELSKALNAGR